ncbi:MAG: lipopolysaccharide kinase InaA family protein [Gemmatimonadaceae bacterium]
MSAPPGYSRVRAPGRATLVARTTHLEAVRDAMDGGTLYEYASHHAEARAIAGRSVVYAVPLPDGETRVVVRHSRHGGVLAALTGDRFLAPTRAPHELACALRLARRGVLTPEVIAYATHPAGPLLRRADVVTREVPNARDLDRALTDADDDGARRAMLDAAAELLRRLAAAGARHPDLNLKNILIAADDDGALEALVIDVDRVWFAAGSAAAVGDANFRRLARSARKRRREHGTPIDERELRALAAAAGASFSSE